MTKYSYMSGDIEIYTAEYDEKTGIASNIQWKVKSDTLDNGLTLHSFGFNKIYAPFDEYVWEEGYVTSPDWLEYLGIKKYDQLEIVRHTFGIRDWNPFNEWFWVHDSNRERPLWNDVCAINDDLWKKLRRLEEIGTDALFD